MKLAADRAPASRRPAHWRRRLRVIIRALTMLARRRPDAPRTRAPIIEEPPPMRAELFSVEQMEQHGKALAATHVLNGHGQRDHLLHRLDHNQQVLLDTCRLLTVAVKSKLRIAPAGEWLLDNFYLIDEQIRTARKHLPKAYSRELPRLAQGPSRGLPRVYDLALEAIAHGDARIDAEALSRFVAAYQTVAPLALGELWAIPIMLRLALIENLRRVGARLTAARLQLNLAQSWADLMMETAERDPKSLILVIADMARSEPPLASPFVAELARRLQGHGPTLALALTWIEQRLAESSRTIEQLVLAENQQQAADQVSISNSIGSLRFLGAMDWRLFVETMSVVEQTLLRDRDGVYGQMDFATRDTYRHVVDRLAKRGRQSEAQVAQAALALAQAHAVKHPEKTHCAHVGYWLIDAGLAQLEVVVGSRKSLLARIGRGLVDRPLGLHAGAILTLTLLFTVALLPQAPGASGTSWALLVLLLILAGSQLATALVNWLVTLLLTPSRLPRMDYARGLPPAMRSLVVIPCMLDGADQIDDLLEALEVRFLGNRDPHLHFGLLTDLCDAVSEHLPADAALMARARAGIEQLNLKYPGSGQDGFLLFHRPRRWNASERVWMGHERKRGKLADLNAVLRGSPLADRFSLVVGGTAALNAVRYVITLDTDTHLPRDTARQLVGAMAHPLNRPRYDQRRQRVCGGYGILQPRMAAHLSGAGRTRYAQLSGSEPGIDPYTRSVSDVYQDLFGEGSFIGKGIYEVDAFEQALKDRFPQNRVLSHDLLEGCYARSGLLSDVDLFEAYPARYDADVKRQQRWIRGDWQIAGWLLPWVRTGKGRHQRNPLSALSRWKIADNLRRSLLPAALVSLLLLGWFALSRPWLWTLAVLGVVLLPPALVVLVDALRKSREVLLRQHLTAVVRAGAHSFALAGFRLACLPYEAQFSVDATLRTLWRMGVSQRGLLEWRVTQHGQEPATAGRVGLVSAHRRMWMAPATALLAGLGLGVLRPETVAVALPVLILWLAAPALAWWLSRPLARRTARLSTGQTVFLRRIARKTWAFFERFVGDDDHHLPPDNYQQQPGPITAHRTSPTNIGMALLANLSAFDFGYLSAGRLLERTALTFRTMAKLERYQGHFYNWYDTRSLLPLPPRYVSSVDSGNLAGHLLTLRAGLQALAERRIVEPRIFTGLADTLSLVAAAAEGAHRARISQLQAQLDAAATLQAQTLAGAMRALLDVERTAALLVQDFAVPADSEAARWTTALAQQCAEALDELRHLAPWLQRAATQSSDAPALAAGADAIPSLHGLIDFAARVLPALSARLEQAHAPPEREWLQTLHEQVALGAEHAAQRLAATAALAAQATDLSDLRFEFLYDRNRHLLAIGYNVDEFRRDVSYYDLLASEARLCSFVAIAQGELPQESWFALSRLLTAAAGEASLVSWSGSMFEYLMPMLVMPSYEGSLLDQTCRTAVATQIAYGQQRGLPWGVSESGYSTVDAGLNYQYHAFGVPGLGLKRGLADDQVVAPYASALALMVDPEAACANLQRLSADGLEGDYGFYEAIDYTPSRQPRTDTLSNVRDGRSTPTPGTVVRSFMAHHQGMSLLSLAHLLLDRPMQQRFEADPRFQATLLLLQERVPKHSVVRIAVDDPSAGSVFHDAATGSMQTPLGAYTPAPEVQLLSNGRYHVMVSNAGGGYSRWKDLAVTRWREDSTCDHWGSFVYLRDVDRGEFWSATHQPTRKRAESYEAMFSEGRAEVRRRDHDIESYCEIVVSPEDDIELRRVRLTNRSRVHRSIEITSYAEVVLAPPAADAMQPAFGNLFVQTEILPARRAILCTRRPRSAGDATPWMFHLVASNGSFVGEVSYETDRVRFVGRGNTLASPQAMTGGAALSGSAGSVLDPITAIRCRLELAPEQSVTLDLVSGAADQRDACLALVDKYQDRHRADRVFDLAWTHSGVTLRQINASEADAQVYRRLASSVIYASAVLRAEASVLIQNRRGQSGLWGYAISGDLPIVLLKIADSSHLELARQMIQCHAYWRLKGLAVDLVIWNEDHVGYRQKLQDQIMGLIATGVEAHVIDRPGGIFVRSAEQISSEDRVLLQAVARIILADTRGTLAEQVHRRAVADTRVPRLVPSRAHRHEPHVEDDRPHPDLILGNALGGFSADGREYVIHTTAAQMTPLPWVNVLANPNFGAVISESGPAYTWSENAHEFRLTPWSDDAVGASAGEAFYLRDEESGHHWSPTPLPRRGAMPYRTRHGFGYSVFEHTSGGIRSELCVYVDLEDAVKYSVLTVRNGSGRARKLSATGYVEWVLGDQRPKTAMHVVTEIDPSSGALFARNAYHTEFGGRVAFFDVDDAARTLSGDRREFLGRNGSLTQPEAMSRQYLSGRLGAALDPCGAIQVPFDLADGQSRQIIFRLGAGHDVDQARKLAQRLRRPGCARDALTRVQDYWTHTLGAVQIETPDAALNVLANGWLVYQTLACRMWARSGYYQSGGAFGFRDQLQDAQALIHADPALLRAHLLHCAARQYPEGDVQHWWHPPSGHGVRTRCSDDYLWLPLATSRYVLSTGDASVLDEDVHFLEGRMLAADEESYYGLPGRAAESASLYRHCVRAILHGLRMGERGLPLMGSGDWNDGMNRVGEHGKGESVWLGFFLFEVLNTFAEVAQQHHDPEFAERCRVEATRLQRNLGRHAWDGQWYRRAWFDDGTPLGSSQNSECSIDSIAQSWSVLSGAGDAQRTQTAMDSMYRRLVRAEQGVVALLDPPFDTSPMNPGYIKGYVPGVRENGGQYTHAAIWAAMAFAKLGDAARAWELLGLINPLNHGRSAQDLATYKAEPYVVAADVYAVAPHTGRGGWTWYTGSAGWLYRLIVESLLGLKLQQGRLGFVPCVPADWQGYRLHYRHGSSVYQIEFRRRAGSGAGGDSGVRVALDGIEQADGLLTLADDGGTHAVTVTW